MIGLTGIQTNIQISLITAISEGNLETVQDIFGNNEYKEGDIQKVLRELIYIDNAIESILSYVTYPDKENEENKVEIIKLIWERAGQKLVIFCVMQR